jgi:ribosomal protein S3
MSSNLAERKAREMIDAFPEEIQHNLMRHVLKTRRPYVVIGLNGARVKWKRSALRDYLRKKYPTTINQRKRIQNPKDSTTRSLAGGRDGE